MSATLVGELHEGREKHVVSDGQGREIVEYTRLFLVNTDAASDDATIAERCQGIPRRGFQYQSQTSADPLALCDAVRAIAVGGNPNAWHVECHYTTRKDAVPEKLRKATLTLSTITEKVLTPYALERQPPSGTSAADFGRPQTIYSGVVPSNQIEPYEPQPTVDMEVGVITVERLEENVHPNIVNFIDAVNAYNYQGFPARTLKMLVRIGVDQFIDNTFSARTVLYELKYRRDTWDLQLLDEGTQYWASAEGVYDGQFGDAGFWPFKDADGNPRRGLLNGRGGALSDGDPEVFLRWRYKHEVDFQVLNLPQFF